MTTSPVQQMAELLIQQSLEGLSVEEQQQLDQLKNENNVSESELKFEMERIELAVAATDLACFQSDTDTIPDHLRDCVLVEAGKYFESQSTVTDTNDQNDALVAPESPEIQDSAINLWMIGTIFSTAACLLLLLNSLNTETIKPPPTVSQNFEMFLASKPADMVKVGLLRGPDASGQNIDSSKSNLYWSDSRQEGYMEIVGLTVNDPNVEQYQLWILRNEKDELPVDGGVFDISSETDLIPIDAKVLAAGKYFAITVEKPGGVVKSSRERIASIGKNFADALSGNSKSEESAP